MKQKIHISRVKIIIPLLLGMIIPFFSYYYLEGKSSLEKSPSSNFDEFINKPLPDSTLLEFQSKISFSNELKNGKVLLMYLASNCQACIKDTQMISRNYSELLSQIKVYGVSVEPFETMQGYITEKKVSFPILVDKNADLFKKLQIRHFPTKLLIIDGIVTKAWIGNFQNENKMFEDLQILENSN